ncbi:MAG: hypothetical protein IJH04_10310 [Eggerthellaceae bacterium]|nr:hypothetical protein [Eggerthellaceae bacterium]
MAAQFGGEIDLSGSKDGLIQGDVYSGRIAIRGAGIQPTHSKLAEEKAWIWMSEKDKLIYFSNIGLHDLKNQYERFCFTHLLADVVARLLAEHGADVGTVSLKRNYLYLDDSGRYEDDHVVFIIPYQQQQDPLASW